MRTYGAGLLAALVWIGLTALAPLPLGAAPLPASVLVLDSGNTNAALSLSGDNQLIAHKGSVVVNSCHSFALYNANSRVEARAGVISVCGAAQRLGKASFSPEPQTGTAAGADPYVQTAWPPAGPVVSRQRLFLSGEEPRRLSPGLYLGGLSCTGKNLRVTLEPGQYVMADGDLFVSGAQLSGDGVTILMSGGAPGKILLANGSKVQLSAPKQGPLKDLALVSMRKLRGDDTDIAFNGVTATLDGVIYAPNGRVGVYAGAKVTAGAVVSFAVMMNSGGVLEVLGER